MTLFWTFLLACSRGPSETCEQMVACDLAWADIDDEREPDWAGDADPLYGVDGSCWGDKESAAACDAACANQLDAYRGALELLEDEGEVAGTPGACLP